VNSATRRASSNDSQLRVMVAHHPRVISDDRVNRPATKERAADRSPPRTRAGVQLTTSLSNP
jgi:hypothetical protein